MRENGLQYTFAVGSQSITWNPTGWAGAGWIVEAIDFTPGVRASVEDRPRVSGSYLDPGVQSGMLGAVSLLNFGSSASDRESRKNAMIQALVLSLAGSSTGTLSWTAQDGATATQLTGLQLVGNYQVSQVGGTLKRLQFQLQSEKPYAESASATTVDSSSLSASGSGFAVPLTVPFTLTSSGGGQLTYTNSGSVPVYPVLRVYGPAVNPNVINVTSGYTLSFAGSIASGDFWEIDLFQRTVTLNGVSTSSVLSSLTTSTSDWFGLAVGSSTLQLTCSGYDTSNTKLRAYQRSAWG